MLGQQWKYHTPSRGVNPSDKTKMNPETAVQRLTEHIFRNQANLGRIFSHFNATLPKY